MLILSSANEHISRHGKSSEESESGETETAVRDEATLRSQGEHRQPPIDLERDLL
ncbi:MAG: hypothetical protein ABW185_04385 [Sedimenticola sp.]